MNKYWAKTLKNNLYRLVFSQQGQICLAVVMTIYRLTAIILLPEK